MHHFIPSTRNLAKDLDGTVDAHHRRLCSDVSVPIPECGMNSCLDEGRKCCAKIHTDLDVKCMLNGEGNVCKCSEEGLCYVDLRCNQNGQWGRGAAALEKFWCIYENCAHGPSGQGYCRVKPNSNCDLRGGATPCWSGHECRKNKCKDGYESSCIEEEDPKYTCKPVELPACPVECQLTGRKCCKAQTEGGKCILNQNGSGCNCSENGNKPCYIDMRCEYEKSFDQTYNECRVKHWGYCDTLNPCGHNLNCKCFVQSFVQCCTAQEWFERL